jgi:hypothetical protein
MPTSGRAFAAVAHVLADIDPRDREAVTTFYRRRFLEYPMSVRALISDFLVGQTGEPSVTALNELKEAIERPLEEIPTVDAPAWDGPPMEYLPDNNLKSAVAGSAAGG